MVERIDKVYSLNALRKLLSTDYNINRIKVYYYIVIFI